VQGSFLQLAGGRLKLGQSLLPVGWEPKRGHRLLCTGRGDGMRKMEAASPANQDGVVGGSPAPIPIRSGTIQGNRRIIGYTCVHFCAANP
jgi:hypothetical protein